MHAKNLSLIVAMTPGGTIGKDNTLPWRLPSDLRRFKEITRRHPVIMGRRNWESIPKKYRPLPDRTNIVLTRQEDYVAEGAVVVTSRDDALAAAATAPSERGETFIIGGTEIYKLFLPLVRTMYVTKVFAGVEGDTFFPNLADWNWNRDDDVAKEMGIPAHFLSRHHAPGDQYPTEFIVLTRPHAEVRD